MKVIYAQQPLPISFQKSIFLAGPAPRTSDVQSWRGEAIKTLEHLGFDGVVFSPELQNIPEDKSDFDWSAQTQWEDDALNMSDCIIFWIPRELEKMPGLTTNDEWGFWKNSGKVVFGAPDKAKKVAYQKLYADKFMVPKADTLIETCKNAVDKLHDPMPTTRFGGERNVPLMIWKTPAFTNWYSAQSKAGNSLKSARLLWSFRAGPNKDFMFAYALHVEVFVKAEDRVKSNEFIFSRTDTCSAVLYRGKEIVLVKEFRSPVRNTDCFVLENPGGSSFKKHLNPAQVVAEEVNEETGLTLNADRFYYVADRQVAATLSTHHTHLFAAKLTEEEMSLVKTHELENKMFGNYVTDSEQTYLRVMSLDEVLTSSDIDWATLGMIMKVVS